MSLCTIGSDYLFGTSMFTGHAECSSFTPTSSKPGHFGCSEEQQAFTVLSEKNCAYENKCWCRRIGFIVLCILAAEVKRWSCFAISLEIVSPASWGWEKLRHALELSGVV